MAIILYCPFCGHRDCDHFCGWTEDGKTVTDVRTARDMGGTDFLVNKGAEIQGNWFIIKTGVSARVYRPVIREP